MGFSGKISSSFLRQSAVVQIVLVNAVVFVIVHIAALFGIGYAGEWLMLPQSWTEVMSTPWTLLTYMFAHFDFLHILGNMLCLYCFGIVALDLMTPADLPAQLPTYSRRNLCHRRDLSDLRRRSWRWRRQRC